MPPFEQILKKLTIVLCTHPHPLSIRVACFAKKAQRPERLTIPGYFDFSYLYQVISIDQIEQNWFIYDILVRHKQFWTRPKIRSITLLNTHISYNKTIEK